MRVAARVLAMVVAAVGFALLAAEPGAAQAAPVRLTVHAGWGGRFIPGAGVPVAVDVAATRLVAGTLEIAGGVEPLVRLPVEVAGGTTKRVGVTAAVPPGTGDTARVTVTVRDRQERVVASAAGELRAAGDDELVGILPGALAGRAVPGPAPLSVDVGTARFSALEERVLDDRALEALSTIVAAADDVGRLTPARQAVLRRWVHGGGRLLVDVSPGTLLPGLPESWQPAAGRAAAGLGEVVATGGAVAAGRWAGLVDPTARAAGSGAPHFFGGPITLADSLARDAGLRLVRLGGLLAFLAAYILLVAPVAFVVLRRQGRAELAWIAVPLVAVVFTAGGWAFGRSLRGDAVLSHGTVIASTPDGAADVTTFLGVTARTAGARSIALPPGWSSDVAARGFEHDGGPRSARPLIVEVVGEGQRVRLPLATGQFGVVGMRGTDDRAASETLRLSVQVGADNVARGAVTNATPWPLEEVAVFLGPRVHHVGHLDAHASAGVVLAPAGEGAVGEPAVNRAWSRYTGFNQPADLDGPVNLALWNAASWRAAPGVGISGGTVVAAGWTDRYVPPVRVGGKQAKGRTVVVGRSAVEVAGPLTEIASRYELVRGVHADPVGGVNVAGRIVVRLDVPGSIRARVDSRQLRAHVPFSGQAVEVWDGSQWREAVADPPQARPSGRGSGGRGDVPRPIPVGEPAVVGPDGMRFVDVALPPGALTPAGVFLRMPPEGPLLGVAGVGLREAQP